MRLVAILALVLTPALVPAEPVPKAGLPRLIVASSNKTGNHDIYLIQPDTGEVKNLTDRDSTDADPVWAPDGKRIAFLSDRGGQQDVWTMAADGTDVKQLTKMPGGCFHLRWSPDGSRIAFVSVTTKQNNQSMSDVYTVEVATGTVKQLTSGPSDSVEPEWAPDGKRLLYRYLGGGLYAVNPDGHGGQQVARGSEAAWAPDGKRIAVAAYHEGPPGGYQLFTTGANGTDAKQLTTTVNRHGFVRPQWAPDGTAIAFDESVDDSLQVATINADGTGLKIVTKTHRHEFPRWAPDGKSLSYHRTESGKQPVLVVSAADGTGAKVLLTNVTSPGEWKPK